MRVDETETYREWINALKDRAGRARIQRSKVTSRWRSIWPGIFRS